MAQEHVVTEQGIQKSRVSRIFGQYIVKNRFQFKFALVVFLFLAVAAVTIYLEGRFVINSLIERAVVTDEVAVGQLKILNSMIFYTSVLALAITFGLALFFSHFIAGPIYRFEKIFEQMKQGDLTAIVRLRKHDELQDTAESFNYALASLRQKLRKDRETVQMGSEKLRNVAEALKKAGRKEEALEIEQVLFDIQNNPPQIKI